MMSCDMKYFTSDANEVVNIFFVSEPKDMDNPKNAYKPKMTHQIFDKESIFGYCGLQINLYYSNQTYYCFVEVTFDQIWEEGMLGMKADNIICSFVPWLRDALIPSKCDFFKILSSSKNRFCFGEVLHEFQHEVLQDEKEILYASITNCDINDKNFEMLHKRFESLIIMYIDAANFIEFLDNNWKVIYLYKKKTVQPNITFYYPIGFCTIYIFNLTDIGRISQFFIIPKYQRKGLGFTLLMTVYDFLRSNRFSLKTITVESPNEMFTDLRDKVDLTHCLSLPAFAKEEIMRGFTKDMYMQAKTRFKMRRKQARKVYEILRAFYCEPGTKEYERFKSDFIKDRQLEMFGLKDLSPEEKDEFLLISDDDIILEAKNLNHSFEKFMLSIVNVLRYLHKKEHDSA